MLIVYLQPISHSISLLPGSISHIRMHARFFYTSGKKNCDFNYFYIFTLFSFSFHLKRPWLFSWKCITFQGVTKQNKWKKKIIMKIPTRDQQCEVLLFVWWLQHNTHKHMQFLLCCLCNLTGI